MSADYLDHFIKILLAATLTGLLGLERDVHGRVAGFRTHVLVGVGSAIFTIISFEVAKSATVLIKPGMMGLSDPGRISAQIIAGVGFLGAGAIIKSGVNVRGLTTAACLWMAAAIGMAVGSGMYVLSLISTGMILFILLGLNRLISKIPSHSYRNLMITFHQDTDTSSIIKTIKGLDIKILNADFFNDYTKDELKMTLTIRMFHSGLTDKYFHKVKQALLESKVEVKALRWGR